MILGISQKVKLLHENRLASRTLALFTQIIFKQVLIKGMDDQNADHPSPLQYLRSCNSDSIFFFKKYSYFCTLLNKENTFFNHTYVQF